jgi:VIT1/CCC1 family predicted Fe2+/Mn2+ transporter
MKHEYKKSTVFGAADGVTSVLGLLVTLSSQPHTLVKAALGVGLAELVGMTAGEWLSSEEDEGFLASLMNGLASFAAVMLPVVPYVLLVGHSAIIAAAVLVVLIGAFISWLRPESGIKAVAETYGVLLIAATICTAASFI